MMMMMNASIIESHSTPSLITMQHYCEADFEDLKQTNEY